METFGEGFGPDQFARAVASEDPSKLNSVKAIETNWCSSARWASEEEIPLYRHSRRRIRTLDPRLPEGALA